ncbi:MAG: hypothetical protein HY319_00760 [Armatimonadetes bacterium]|nr:hypothetical protein [Armatimonadota bacterium]
MSDKLYVVYGAGNDAVGLVEQITTAIAGAGGNIIDLRQDALHGLFTIDLVTDLGATELRLEQFRDLIRNIGEDTGLDLHVAKYVPNPRSADTRSLLLVLLGRDRPGIISRVSKDLSSHKINIEFSRMIAREGIFLMELLTDISQCTLPPGNLESVVREPMAAVGIRSMFQQQDVFNPKKRIILFDIAGSFISRDLLSEILDQARLSWQELAQEDPAAAAARLESLPTEVFGQIVRSLEVTPDSLELVHTLKRMGYRTALAARAFSPVTDLLKEKLGLDYAYGCPLGVDDDSQTLTGRLGEGESPETESVIARLLEAESVTREDVSIIEDHPDDPFPPGIRIQFPMRLVLDYVNQRVLSRETLSGVLGSFGLLRSGPRKG